MEVEGLPPQWVPWAKGSEEEFSATISRMRVSMQVSVQALQLPMSAADRGLECMSEQSNTAPHEVNGDVQ